MGETTEVEWSPNGELLLCTCRRGSVFEVRSIHDVTFTATIHEDRDGGTEATWGSDSRHVVSFAPCGVRATVWSLTDNIAVHELSHPKLGIDGVAFRNDGALVAAVSRTGGRDIVRIFDVTSWEEFSSFEPPTKDLAGLSWNPDGHSLVVWDTRLEYFVAVYNPHGRLQKRFTAYNNALGVRSVKWSADGSMIAIASCDNTVRILLTTTWRVLTEFEHADTIDPDVVIFREEYNPLNRTTGFVVVDTTETPTPPVLSSLLSPLSSTSSNASSLPGINCIEWSANGRYLASVDVHYPYAVRIWDIYHRRLTAVILQRHPISTFHWDPAQERLAISTMTGKLYTWRPEGSACITLPIEPFSCHSVHFNTNGDTLLLQDNAQCTIAYDGLQAT